jgi:replicative DNA helicase
MADRAAGGAPPWWSDLYTGRAGQDTLLLLIQQHAEELAKLPLYLKTDQGVQGWAYQQIRVAVKELRQAHPHAPTVLVVVDFLQLLVGTDDREDLRQRIGRAAYQARLVAREMGAAILLISATSRDNYGRLNVVLGTNGVPTVAPSSLVGAGKESGEIEYAADAALVLARASGDEAGNGCDSDAVWVAVAKSRVGGAGWYRLVERQGWFGEESEVGPKAESPTASGGGSGKRKSDRHAAKVATPGTPGGKSDHANPWDR